MTSDQLTIYRAALAEARVAFTMATQRLNELSKEQIDLIDQIGRLRRTITALSALCSESPGFDQLGITESCMDVMESQRGVVTTQEVVDALEAMGFDLTTQKNAAASVHTVLSRLAKQGKIEKVSSDEKKDGLVYWRGPNFDANSDIEEIKL
jgi:ribosome maturation protein Sdo1